MSKVDSIASAVAAAATLPDGFSPLTCTAVRAETPTIKTFVLEPEDPALLAFEAGQAMAISVAAGGEWLVRTFSISSTPGKRALELTIKAHAQGRATRWLHDNLGPGRAIGARPPRGRFTLAAASSRRIAFVSAGSGATPLMSMLRSLDEAGETLDIAWHHTASAADELLFAGELSALQARHPGLAVTMALSRPAPGWFGYRGRISRRLLSTSVPDIGARDVFCCGPVGFMDTVKLIHAAEGGGGARFHSESFGGLAQPAEPVVSPKASVGPGHQLTIGGRTIEVAANETILQAALRQGVIIPCGCGQGLCGTCIVKGIEGEFRMSHQGGLAPDEEKAGYLLACSTRLASAAAIAL